VDGDVLFCLTGHGELLCVETKGGKVRWRVNLRKNLGGEMASGWGYSESVLVDGDRVICTPGGGKGALAALDKKNGKVVWRSTKWTARATYSSIIVAEIGGVKQYVQVTGSGVAGIAAEDGELLWQSNQSAHGISVSTPVHKDGLVYVSTGYGVGGGAVKVTKDGDSFKSEKLYDRDEQKLMCNHHGGFVLVGDHIYGYSDSRGWICQELKTGKLVWRGNTRDFGKGSLTCADGQLYCYTESGGKVALVEATTTGWKQNGRFTIPKRSKRNRHQNAWTHPVVANGRLYLRDQEYIFCYDVSENRAASR
jgi:outer membrane protein assembly factor BamB